MGAILVMDFGHLRGIFSERDLMLRVVIQRRDAETTTVSAVMSTEVTNIDEGATAEEGMEAMHRRLPSPAVK